MQHDETILPLVSETATLHKHEVITGRVRVHTRSTTREELVSAALERQDVEVTRVAIGRDVDAIPPIRTEGNVTIIPVVEEVLVVEKRLVLREEIHLRQITTSEAVEVPVMLQSQHAVVERDDMTNTSNEEDM